MIKNKLRNALLKYTFKNFPERKLFCPLPFKHMEIMPSGKTNLCCFVKKSPGKIEKDNLIEIYNSPSARAIRESILDGTFRFCNLEACPHFSASNLPLQKDCMGTEYEAIIKQGKTALKNMNLWLSFDLRCNLRCISCRKDVVRYSDEEHRETERLLTIVRSNLSSIKRIGLNGSGDPFASPSMRNFLNNLNSTDYPDLKVSILTNGLLLNQKAWESMKMGNALIKSVQVSIDAACEETYKRIRRGGSFDLLMNNLAFISHLRQQDIIDEFIISFVINAINYSEMDAFVHIGLKHGCDQVYFSYMVDWGVLTSEEYADLAVHLPGHKMHQEFKNKLENSIFDHPIVNLGNIKRFKANKLLRDSLFS